MNTADLASKWRSFNWDVFEIDGHDIQQLYDTFSSFKKQENPTAVIANTVKEKDFPYRRIIMHGIILLYQNHSMKFV